MVFSSLIFLYAFFSLSLGAYALCRSQKAQNTVLLVFHNHVKTSICEKTRENKRKEEILANLLLV